MGDGRGTCRRSVAMAVGSVGSWHNACISQRCKQRTSAWRQDVPSSALQMLFTEMTHSEDESLCGELEWHEERYHNNAIIVLMVTSYNRGVNISSINRCGVGKTQKARAETQWHVKAFVEEQTMCALLLLWQYYIRDVCEKKLVAGAIQACVCCLCLLYGSVSFQAMCCWGNLFSTVTVSNSIRCGLNHSGSTAVLCINTHAETVVVWMCESV